MTTEDQPFSRRRRGLLVDPLSKRAIWETADQVRAIIGVTELRFPIMSVLEFALPEYMSEFSLEIRTRSDLDHDEGRAVPSRNTILLADDVYAAAWADEERARFTAAHEFGHFLLHREVSLPRPSDDFPVYRDAEWQADTFAGALLMSPKHCQRFSSALQMARECGVSLAAAQVMWAKFREEGLV